MFLNEILKEQSKTTIVRKPGDKKSMFGVLKINKTFNRFLELNMQKGNTNNFGNANNLLVASDRSSLKLTTPQESN